MNKTKRFSFGLLSSLLLAAGFVHAADQLDPITHETNFRENDSVMTAAVECTSSCAEDLN